MFRKIRFIFNEIINSKAGKVFTGRVSTLLSLLLCLLVYIFFPGEDRMDNNYDFLVFYILASFFSLPYIFTKNKWWKIQLALVANFLLIIASFADFVSNYSNFFIFIFSFWVILSLSLESKKFLNNNKTSAVEGGEKRLKFGTKIKKHKSSIVLFILIFSSFAGIFYTTIYPRVFDCRLNQYNAKVVHSSTSGSGIKDSKYYTGKYKPCYKTTKDGNLIIKIVDTDFDKLFTATSQNRCDDNWREIDDSLSEIYFDGEHIFFEGEKTDWDIETFNFVFASVDEGYYFYSFDFYKSYKPSLYSCNNTRGLAISYFKDKNGLYLEGEELQNRDLETFKVLDVKAQYTSDKKGVYYNNKILEGADTFSFEVLNDFYTKDSNNIYINGKVFVEADVSTFEIFFDYGASSYYSKDKNHIYYLDKIIQGADLETFMPINWQYSNDANYIYHRGVKVEGADVKTFRTSLTIW